ncbi:MAG: hypothetical protein M0Z55_10600 [Peptococcaceae bacterium]|nr:hypothetical protein [Peptococcaceae bacterium]
MKSILKLIGMILVVVIVGAYLIDLQPVSNVLQTGQKSPDPLVAGARSVKQELRTLTDSQHQAVYFGTVKQGLKKAADLLDGLAGDNNVTPPVPAPTRQDLGNSL